MIRGRAPLHFPAERVSMTTETFDIRQLPYKIAVLCYLYDEDGRLLLLHRLKSPNAGMYSPIGGKLDVTAGESPHDCALREIHEEAGLTLDSADARLTGIVSETAYEGETHWLIFLFEIMRPIRHEEIPNMTFDEGTMEWIALEDIADLKIPETDRTIIGPLVRQHRGGFFMVHIDCSVDPMTWTVQEEDASAPNG
jgi:8-oxo-dGTP diphosphatase